MIDAPRMLGDPAAVNQRLSQLREPHIAPLTKFVEDLKAKLGPDTSVPYFDPWDGGVNAEILFLLEAPGPKADGSGLISRNNPDPSAKNWFELHSEAGIDRKRVVLWNIVPWYLGSGSAKPNPNEIRRGKGMLAPLLKLLPKVHTIVLVGGSAWKVEQYIRERWPQMGVYRTYHPGAKFINRRPENRSILLKQLREVRKKAVKAKAEPHASDSSHQRAIEARMLDAFGQESGWILKQNVRLPEAPNFQPDGVDLENRVVVEVVARVGKLKAGQQRKTLMDATKLSYLRGRLGPNWRLVLLYRCEDAAAFMRGKSWQAEFSRQHDIEVAVVELSEQDRQATLAAQREQAVGMTRG